MVRTDEHGGANMKLNMHIILEDLADLHPKALLQENRLERRFSFHSPMVDGACPYADQVYIVSADQLADALDAGRMPTASFICAGTPPAPFTQPVRAGDGGSALRAGAWSIIWVEDATLDKLVMRLTEEFNAYMQWELAMRTQISKGVPLKELARISSPIVRRPIWMWDENFQTLFNFTDKRYYTLPDDYLLQSDESVWQAWMVNQWTEQTASGPRENLLQLHEPYLMPTPSTGFVSYDCLCQNVFRNGQRVASVCVDGIGGPLTDRDHALIGALAEFMSDALNYGADTNFSMASDAGDCLLRLIRNETVGFQEINWCFDQFGWDAGDAYCAVVVEPVSATYGNRLLSQLGNDLHAVVPGSVYLIVEHRVIVACNLDASGLTLDQMGTTVHALAESLDFKVRMGVSSQWRGIKRLSRCYRQALLALQTGVAWRLGDIVHFDEVIYQVVLKRLNGSEGDLMVPYGIRALNDHDREYGCNDIEILRAYLDHNCSPTATARVLFMHRNTLMYRLQKIEEIAGIDFADPESRFTASLALRLIE